MSHQYVSHKLHPLTPTPPPRPSQQTVNPSSQNTQFLFCSKPLLGTSVVKWTDLQSLPLSGLIGLRKYTQDEKGEQSKNHQRLPGRLHGRSLHGVCRVFGTPLLRMAKGPGTSPISPVLCVCNDCGGETCEKGSRASCHLSQLCLCSLLQQKGPHPTLQDWMAHRHC